MLNRKGEISTIIILGTLVVIGIGALMSSTINQEQQTLNTRAEFDGTFCNDNIEDSLNGSGNTSFNINCWGNLNRQYLYVLFWCPEQKQGAPYCGDVRDIAGSQAQILDQAQGATVPTNITKSTDKTCGCVSWQVGVRNTNGEIGWAGAAMLCSTNACDSNTPTSQPTNIPPTSRPPSNPPPTNRPATTNPQPTRPPQNPTQRPSNTPTPTKTKLPNGTSCIDGSTCRSGCCSNGLCNSENMCKNACRPGQIKCVGTNICVDFQDQCPAPSPTRVPTYAQQNDEYPITPTPTPRRGMAGLVDRVSQPTPTPVPTVVRKEQIQTQNDTILQSCFDKNGQFVLTQTCAVESLEEFLKLIDGL